MLAHLNRILHSTLSEGLQKELFYVGCAHQGDTGGIKVTVV